MIKGLLLIMVLVVLVFVVCLCLYGLYRRIMRENDMDVAVIEDAEYNLQLEHEHLQQTLYNARKNRDA